MPYEVLEPEAKGNFTVLEPEGPIQNLNQTRLAGATDWVRRNLFDPAVGMAKIPLEVSDKAVGLVGEGVRSVINLPSILRSYAKGETAQQYKPTLAPGQPIVSPEAVDFVLRNLSLRSALDAEMGILNRLGLPFPKELTPDRYPTTPTQGVLEDIRKGAVGEISQFTTPENVGIAVLTAGAGGIAPKLRPLINKIVSTTFLSQLLGQAVPEQVQRTVQEPTGENVGRLGALGLAGFGLGREAVRPMPEVGPSGIVPTEPNPQLLKDLSEQLGVPIERQLKAPPTAIELAQARVQAQQPPVPTQPTFVAGPQGIVPVGGNVGAYYDVAQPRGPMGYLQAPPIQQGPTVIGQTLENVGRQLRGEPVEPPPPGSRVGTRDVPLPADYKVPRHPDYMPAPTIRMMSGVDPESLRPAIQLGEKLLIGMRGDTHVDVLERNGIDPKTITHGDPRRVFATEDGKQVFDRREAERVTGIPGTAEAGGLDSQDLPGAGRAKLERMMEEQPNAIRELRTDQLPQAQPPGGIQKVGEEIRQGTETEGVAQKTGQEHLVPGKFYSWRGRRVEYTREHPREPGYAEVVMRDQSSLEGKTTSLPTSQLTPWEEGVTRQGQEQALMGRVSVEKANIRQLINQYLGRERGTTEAGRKSIFGGRIEDLEASDLKAMYDRLEQVHKERLSRQVPATREAGEGQARQDVAVGVENTLWNKIREQFMRYGLRHGENVAKYSRAELERVRENLLQTLNKQYESGGKKLSEGTESSLHTTLRGVSDLLKAPSKSQLPKEQWLKAHEENYQKELALRWKILQRAFDENIDSLPAKNKAVEKYSTPEEKQELARLTQERRGLEEHPNSYQWLGEQARGRTQAPPESGTEFFSGIPSLRGTLHQLNVERKALQFLVSSAHRGNVDKLFSSLDAVDTRTLTFGNKAEEHVKLTAEDVAGRKNMKDADISAIAYMAAKGDPQNLPALRALVPNHKEALKAIDYASAHWDHAEAVANAALEVDRQNMAMARANGVDIPTLDFYLKQMYKAKDESIIFRGRHSPGIGIGSRLPRAHENIFEAINAGLEPLSLSASALVNKRTVEIQREINTKNWLENFRRVQDPLSGSPLVANMIPRRGNRPAHPPPDYVSVPGLELAVHKNYAPLFEIATGKSILASSKVASAILETEGVLKHSILAFDFFHLFRLANFGKSFGFKVRYKKGWSMLEYSPTDLAKAVQLGHAPPEAIVYQNQRVTVPQGTFTRREIGYLGSKNGANWGRHSEALYTHVIRKVPVLGRFNRFVFDRMSRGMMYEAFQLEFERVGNTHPQWTKDQVARSVARNLNFRMGNIGRQGVIKSATMQDITFALALAPRWVESMIQSEVRGVTQVAKALATGKPRSVETMGYSMGKLVAYYFVATQTLNMLLNDGKTTFDNDNNRGHELDLFFPPLRKGDKGFFVSPLAVPMEVTHDIVRYVRGGMDMGEALAQIAENKLSPLAQGAKTLVTGKDWRGVEQENRFTGALKTALNPSPLPLRQGIESLKQESLVPIERQGFSMMGIKAEPETTGQQIARETKGMNIGERLVDAAQREREQKAKPRTLEEHTASSVRASENEAENRKRVNKALEKPDRQWLTSRGLILPGYTASVTIGGQRMRLSDAEREHYEQMIVSNYSRIMPVLRRVYDNLPEAGQKRLFSTATSEAKRLATQQLIKEMSVSKSESNKRFTILP